MNRPHEQGQYKRILEQWLDDTLQKHSHKCCRRQVTKRHNMGMHTWMSCAVVAITMATLPIPTHSFLAHWIHPDTPNDVSVDDGNLVVSQPSSDSTTALLLTQQASVKLVDCGPPLVDAQPIAKRIEDYMKTAVDIIWESDSFAQPPIISVGLSYSSDSTQCSQEYQLDMAIYIVFTTSKQAGSAKYDFEEHDGFGQSFRAVFTIAVHGALVGREITLDGPPLSIDFVQGPQGQPFDTSGVQFVPSNNNNNPLAQPNMFSPGKKAKSHKKGHKMAKYSGATSTRGNNQSTHGTHIIVVGVVAYVCVASLIAIVGYRHWSGRQYEDIDKQSFDEADQGLLKSSNSNEYSSYQAL